MLVTAAWSYRYAV